MTEMTERRKNDGKMTEGRKNDEKMMVENFEL